MELKEINKMIQPSNDEERPKAVKCVCINYEDFYQTVRALFKSVIKILNVILKINLK